MIQTYLLHSADINLLQHQASDIAIDSQLFDKDMQPLY